MHIEDNMQQNLYEKRATTIYIHYKSKNNPKFYAGAGKVR